MSIKIEPKIDTLFFKLAAERKVVNKKEPPGDDGGSFWQKGMKEDFLIL